MHSPSWLTDGRFMAVLRLGKRMKFGGLGWPPWQSLASSRVPSLAWCPATVTAKRRQGGLQAGTKVNGVLAPKSKSVGVADPITPRGRQNSGTREWRVSRGASGVCTAGMQLRTSLRTREIRQAQGVLVGSDKREARGRSDGLAEVRLTDSTPRSGEPATWGSGQRRETCSKET
jgi:hypothetical protein